MTFVTSTRRRPALLPALLPVLIAVLCPALPGLAAAADVELEIITIKATGKPSGSDPVIDESIRDLPAVKGLCRMYARCEREAKTTKKVDWGTEVGVGSGKSRLAVGAEDAGDGERVVLAVRIGGSDAACLESSSSVAAGKPVVQFCERSLPDGTYIHVITARPLGS